MKTTDKLNKCFCHPRSVVNNHRQFLWVKKNMFTAVLVVDPGTPEGLFNLCMMQTYLTQGLPARLGAILLPSSPPSRAHVWSNWAKAAKSGVAPGRATMVPP